MPEQKNKEAQLSVTWLQKNEPENVIDLSKGTPTQLQHDVFSKTEKIQMHDTTSALGQLQDAFEKGQITLQDFIEKMDEFDKVNRSHGKSVLFDGRKKAKTRIREYVEFAVANGQDAEEAARVAALAIAEYNRKTGNTSSRGGWGGISAVHDIRKKK